MFLSNKCDQRLKAAFELYNQQLSDNLPNKDELKTITFSQTFETKMKKLLAAQKKSYYYMKKNSNYYYCFINYSYRYNIWRQSDQRNSHRVYNRNIRKIHKNINNK